MDDQIGRDRCHAEHAEAAVILNSDKQHARIKGAIQRCRSNATIEKRCYYLIVRSRSAGDGELILVLKSAPEPEGFSGYVPEAYPDLIPAGRSF